MLEKLKELLKLEKEEDYERHVELMNRLTDEEKVKKGFIWNHVLVQKSGYTIGERAFVQLERNPNEKKGHQFKAGATVVFKTSQDVYRPEEVGIIQFVERGRMRIVLNSKDVPDWLHMGKLRVEMQFDERTYLEMERALKLVENAKGNRLAELRDIVYKKRQPYFSDRFQDFELPELNPAQQGAVQQILSAEDFAIVHGPPGTGKTTTTVQAIKQLVKFEKTVLVCAPSNAAVDLLTERLSEQGISVLRIGNLSRVDEQLIQHTLEGKMNAHPESKNIKKVRIEAAAARKEGKRYKRSFGQKERESRSAMFKEAKDLMAWAKELEQRLIDQLIDGAQAITCTLVGSANRVLRGLEFNTVVIDEAAQAMEPATWIPMLKANRVVLAGDPFQLPPSIMSQEAKKNGLGITLLEKCTQQFDKVGFLNIQYRMHESIMGFSNAIFYKNELEAHHSVKDHKLEGDEEQSVIFIDTAGCGFEEKLEPEYQSRYNPGEYMVMREHLLQLMPQLSSESPPSIGIISPYRQQVNHIKQEFREDGDLSTLPNLTINTIDSFQGQERDVIYISLVRSNEKGEIGFLKDYRRMNVAMTRAKKKLIIIGDSATLAADNFYSKFLDYVDEKGTYQSAFEYLQ